MSTQQDIRVSGSESMRKLMASAHGLLAAQVEDGDTSVGLASLAAPNFLDDEVRQRVAEIASLLGPQHVEAALLEAVRRAGQFDLHPAPDRMQLLLNVSPPFAGGEPVTGRQVLEALGAQGITEGVLHPGIETAVKRGLTEPVRDVTIVQGRPAGVTHDERLSIRLRRQLDREPEEVDDLSRPSTTAREYWFCRQGDCIGVVHPGRRGAPGITALGEVLCAPEVKTVKLHAGALVRQDGHRFIAEAAGVVFRVEDTIEVRRLLVLTRDLTRQDEPIQFDGDVLIRAALRDGAQVRASGSIVVTGMVEAAQIHSNMGTVELQGGITGRGRGQVTARQDIHARFAENALLQTDGDIHLASAAIHCQLTAAGSILCMHGRGQIFGGTIMASARVEAKCLGAPAGVATSVMVGLGSQEMRTLGELDRRISQAMDHRAQVAELIERIRRTVGDPARLAIADRQAFAALLKMDLKLHMTLSQLQVHRTAVLQSVQHTGRGEVTVYREILPRVSIHIGNRVYRSTEASGPGRFHYDSDLEIIVKGPV